MRLLFRPLRYAMVWTTALAAFGGGALRAQTPDTTHPAGTAAHAPGSADTARAAAGAAPRHPADTTPTATVAAPRRGPSYPLTPTPVLAIGGLGARIDVSGYLSGRATHHSDSTAALINRARLTAQVAPLPYLGVRLQADFSSAQSGRARSDSSVVGFTLTDAYVELAPPLSALTPGSLAAVLRPALLAGQFKAPFSLEYLTPFGILKTADRAQAVYKLSIKRDIGVMAQAGWSRYAAVAVAAMNGAGANATSNPDNHVLAVSRLTVSPFSFLQASAKIADHGTDHAWGYDGRLHWRGLTIEGETVFRKRPTSSTVRLDAGGGYGLVAFRVRPWLEPIYKYDRYWDTRFTTRGDSVTTTPSSHTWHVVGVNLQSIPEWLRLQLDWRHRDERPTPGKVNEFVAQLIASF